MAGRPGAPSAVSWLPLSWGLSPGCGQWSARPAAGCEWHTGCPSMDTPPLTAWSPWSRALEDWQGAMYPPLPLPNPCKHSTPTHLGSQTLSAESSGAESWRSFTALQRSRLDGDPGPHLLRGPSPQIQSHPPGTTSHPACLWARHSATAATLVTGQLQAGLPQKPAESRTRPRLGARTGMCSLRRSLGKPQAPPPPRRGPGASSPHHTPGHFLPSHFYTFFQGGNKHPSPCLIPSPGLSFLTQPLPTPVTPHFILRHPHPL